MEMQMIGDPRKIRSSVRWLGAWVLVCALAPGWLADASVAGYWVGTIEIPGSALEVRITLTAPADPTADKWAGHADILAQGAKGLPLGGISVDAENVKFELAGVPGVPTFRGTLANEELAGTFSQAGQEFPFKLKRSTELPTGAEASTSTEPSIPAGGEASSLDTGSGTLHGTLLLPDGVAPFPVAVIIAGSGPTDRDGNSAITPQRNDSLRKLAEALQSRGFATLRYDKRGVAKSAGAAKLETELRFSDVSDDAAGWVRKLRDDPRFSRIAILGHSEGSLAGMIAARQTGADAFVSVAGPGRPIDVVLNQQFAGQSEEFRTTAAEILAKLRKGETVENVDRSLYALFRPSVQPYLRSWIQLDPSKEIAKLEVPTLIVQGETDIQVALEDGAALRKAQPSARYLQVPKMNHVFREAPLDRAANLAAYQDPSLPLVPAFVDGLAEFLSEALAGAKTDPAAP